MKETKLMNIFNRSKKLVGEQSSAFLFEEATPREEQIKNAILNMGIDIKKVEQFIDSIPKDTTLEELYQISQLIKTKENN